MKSAKKTAQKTAPKSEKVAKTAKAAKATKPAKEKEKKFCVQPDCKQQASSQGYCRLHFIVNWKHIKFNNQIKAERRLNAYVDRLAKKYPKDYLEKIKEGLEDEGKFRESVAELEVEVGEDSPQTATEREFLEKFMRSIKGGDE